MAGSGRKLADAVLAGHLAAGLTHAQAAVKAGVSERTVRRRLDDPKFRKLVEELKGEAVGRAVNILGRTMSGAAVELAKLLKSEEEKTRLQAAKAIIELGMKARQHADLERRLDEVEALLNGDGTGEPDGATDPVAEAGT
jgi:predicted ArsR family transcriptional regulator